MAAMPGGALLVVTSRRATTQRGTIFAVLLLMLDLIRRLRRLICCRHDLMTHRAPTSAALLPSRGAVLVRSRAHGTRQAAHVAHRGVRQEHREGALLKHALTHLD